MKNIFYLFFVFSCLCSCQLPSNNKSLDETNIDIPDSLFFWLNEDSTYFSYDKYILTNARRNLEHVDKQLPVFIESFYIKGRMPADIMSFKKLTDKYRKEAIDSIIPANNNYFIIRNQETILELYPESVLKKKYNDSIDYILPLFHDYTAYRSKMSFDSLTVYGLPWDYEVLIMKSGREFILPQYRRYDWPVLPESLKHGYTSGVAFRHSYDMILYWTVAW